MIPLTHTTGRHAGPRPMVEHRPTPIGQCPGMHCAGRQRVHEHRSGMIPTHFLTPQQVKAARGEKMMGLTR